MSSMGTRSIHLPLLVALTASCIVLLLSALAHAETPYERDQREQLEKYQREHGLSPQVQQAERWKAQWRQQHPNEPVPNLGVLEKLHRDEIIANMNRGFADMRQRRQAQLQQNYLMAKQHQQQILAAQHITWDAAQWQEWNRQYDAEQQQRARDYLEAVKQAGEMARLEKERDEAEKLRKQAQ